MSKTKTLHYSFAGGVVSHNMFARIDDPQYKSSASILDNFIVKAQAVVENRAGLEYVANTKYKDKKAVLVSFKYSIKQTFVIEVGEGYFRFFSKGKALIKNGRPYEVANRYKEKDLDELQSVQAEASLVFTHQDHPPTELTRHGQLNWTFEIIAFVNKITPPVDAKATVKNSPDKDTKTHENMSYVVASVDKDKIRQSVPSAVTTCKNNIYATGASNEVTWTAVAGASRYNVYKERGGLFGYIGSTEGTSLVDNNIAPDMGITPPRLRDKQFGKIDGEYPAAVGFINQRRIFAGTKNRPQTMWLTKTGTTDDLTYSIPVQSTDRIKLRIVSGQLNQIRHVVGLGGLIVLTESGEWEVNPDNSDLSATPQSYVGASAVQPVVVGNNLVYVTERGSYLRNLNYDWRSKGFVTSDLSVKASHLFDKTNVKGMALSKFPNQVIWAVSSDGTMTTLTYLPDQEIASFSRQVTNGKFESCCTTPESSEDFLYTIVARKIKGETVRFVERMASRREPEDHRDYFFVDCGLTYDGRISDNPIKIETLNGKWSEAAQLKITATKPVFTSLKPKDAVLAGECCKYRFVVTKIISSTVVECYLPQELPERLRDKPIQKWELAKSIFSGLDHLEGEKVAVLADGSTHRQLIVENGMIEIDRSSSVVHAGLPYASDLKTLPLVIEEEGMGRGRTKNLNKAWLRLHRSSGVWAGADFCDLTEIRQRKVAAYGDPPNLKSEIVPINLKSRWSYEGVVCVRQTDPLPLNIAGITLEISVGG